MQYLVIPDVHEELKQLEAALQHSKKAEKTIFLGDFFDSFDKKLARETAEWLSEHLYDDDKIFLMGNHDNHYAYDDSRFRCSGYQHWKKIVIGNVLRRTDWNQFKLFHHDNGYLFAHAGVHPSWFTSIGALEAHARWAQEAASNGGFHQLFNVGHYRGGWADVGGINWLDWNMEFEPVDGLYQIVGHTHGGWKRKRDGGMCIDNGLQSVWLIDTKTGDKEEIEL